MSRGAPVPRLRPALFAAAAAGAALAGLQPARAQDVPEVVSPLRVETDHNGVNLVTGKIVIDVPALSVPAAPNLRFDRVQNAAPYMRGTITAGTPSHSSYSLNTGTGVSESYTCTEVDCTSVTGTGSIFQPTGAGPGTYIQAGSGARWNFNCRQTDVQGAPRVVQYYASSVTYPNGEVITYNYDNTPCGAAQGSASYNRRPTRISSNLGYQIDIVYQGNTFGTNEWGTVRQAALSGGATLLRRMVYDVGSITDYGDNAADSGGRTYVCTGCANQLGVNLEVDSGSLQLPGEGSPAFQAIRTTQTALIPSTGQIKTDNPLVGTVVRDGVTWNYTYGGLTFEAGRGYWWDSLTITGPNGFRRVYAMIVSNRRNVIDSMTENVTATTTRTTDFTFDASYRPTRIVYPEGNRIDVGYDELGNIDTRTATPKAGSGLAAVVERAFYPDPACRTSASPVLCWRPTRFVDARNLETNFQYNARGQMTERLDPADAAGVRRRTSVTYTTGISRRDVVTLCGTGAACGTAAEIRTEYDYFGSTSLPSVERRVSGATILATTYQYDPAGRLEVQDGPLGGTDDTLHYRYDPFGRRIWEIAQLGANGVRLAQRHTYRPADDKVTRTETGTVIDPAATLFAQALLRVDYAYDGRRNPVRETVRGGASSTIQTLLQRTFDDSGRLECEARRMNPAEFLTPPASACDLDTSGSHGPDRITRNLYDNAGQLLQVQRAYRITTANGFPQTLQQNYATYAYTPNGQRSSVADANGNTASLTYDGFDRLRRWTFPSPATGAPNPADYEEYGYDAAGNRTSLRKRDGLTLAYRYDNLNRIDRKTVPERSGLDPIHTRDVFYAYDVRDLVTDARFDSLAGPGVQNDYDGFGRLTSSTTDLWGTGRTVSHLYDAGGRRTRLTWPGGNAMTYVWDAADRLTGLYLGTGTTTLLAGYTYTVRGMPDIRSDGTGASIDNGYDAVGRLASQAHAFDGGVGNLAFTFGYNPASQIVTRTRSNDAYIAPAPTTTDAYTADSLNRIAAVDGAAFGYDANGNLTAQPASVTGSAARTFSYDVENRLVGSGDGVVLHYDPLGRLYQISGGPAPTRRLVWDGDALIAEYNQVNTLMERYAHGGAAGVDDPLIWNRSGAYRRLHPDHQGSIVAITDGAGANYAISRYDEWGVPVEPLVGRFGYTGQIWIPELGLYHYKARMYAPYLGRFMQVDPVGYDDDLNLYAYVGNDLINYVDHSGKCRQGASAVRAYGHGTTTIIMCTDGYNEVRQGGSLAWRNNNPGNIEAGSFATRHGAVGRAGLTARGRFAVFPEIGIGRSALAGLLLTPGYRSLTPLQAIARYAPPEDNDTANYQRIVQAALGDTGDRTIGDLTDSEMGTLLTTIGRVEGWQIGRVTYERQANGGAIVRASYTVTGSRVPRIAQCQIDEESDC